MVASWYVLWIWDLKTRSTLLSPEMNLLWAKTHQGRKKKDQLRPTSRQTPVSSVEMLPKGELLRKNPKLLSCRLFVAKEILFLPLSTLFFISGDLPVLAKGKQKNKKLNREMEVEKLLSPSVDLDRWVGWPKPHHPLISIDGVALHPTCSIIPGAQSCDPWMLTMTLLLGGFGTFF